MPVFAYTGKGRSGEAYQGEVVASDSKEALRLLRQRQMAVTTLRQRPAGVTQQGLESFRSWGAHVNSRDLVAMTHQCATMLKAGIPLLECLNVLSKNSESLALQQTLSMVHADVEGGCMFAEALGKHPRVFSRFYVNMVEVGEATGMLDSILSRLASHMERMVAVKGRVVSALAYPMTLFLVALLVLAFMLTWIVPLFSRMFDEFGQALPWLTLLVLDTGIFLNNNLFMLSVLCIALLIGVRQLYQHAGFRRQFDRFILTVPVIGAVLRKSAVVQFSRTLGALLSSGVTILDGLMIAGKISGNVAVEDVIQRVRVQVREGSTVAEPLRQSAIFPQMVTHMIAVGESTGSLDTMLDKIADLYEQEVDRAVTSLTALFEPMVILMIGLGIGLIVVAMYLPIFTMGSFVG